MFEIENVPEPYLLELLDFIYFLESKDLEQKKRVGNSKLIIF